MTEERFDEIWELFRSNGKAFLGLPDALFAEVLYSLQMERSGFYNSADNTDAGGLV